MRSQSSDGTSAGQSPEWETDRLRQELELTRRQLSEQMRRADNLQRELEISRNKEHEYTQNLAKTLEQVENNLERSNVSMFFSVWHLWLIGVFVGSGEQLLLKAQF